MRSFIVLIICIEVAVIAKLSVSFMTRPAPASINNGNEFMEHCESGLLVVSCKKDNAIAPTFPYCKATQAEGGLALEGNHGYLLVKRIKGEWNLEYKEYD